MKTSFQSKLLAAGFAGMALISSVHADVTLVITGGNASRAVLYDRAAALLSGAAVANLNANTRSYINGTIAGQPGLGNVTIHFVLNGALGGVQDLLAQNNIVTATNSPQTAQLAVTSTAPETIGIDPAPFHQVRTLVIPFAFIKNPAKSANLAGVTNLTQRQAAYLQAASGTLPSAFFGGSGTNDIVYAVGRDTAAAVRQITDASIYFSGTPSFYTTNTGAYVSNATYNATHGNIYTNSPIGRPVPHPLGGHNSGALVVADLNVLTNAIGIVASGDFGAFTTLSYEGYQPTAANVAKGNYPIWGYERWLYKNSGAGQPSANQLAVINALLNTVTDIAYQHTAGNSFDTGKFVPLGDLEVERTADGGPITSLLY